MTIQLLHPRLVSSICFNEMQKKKFRRMLMLV